MLTAQAKAGLGWCHEAWAWEEAGSIVHVGLRAVGNREKTPSLGSAAWASSRILVGTEQASQTVI